tara:strand:+ start:145 stop:1254 length:1110 start_codon:yes stop_codon:yes gene_type:complete
MKTLFMLEYRKIRLLFIVFTLIHLTNCSSVQKVEIENFQGIIISNDSIDAYVKTKMEELKIPGASLAIINKGKLVHHQTYGYANFEKKLKVTENTIFEGASISKSVFSFFVMKYVEEGKLDLDKPLFKYLEYPDIAYDERYKKITARMVLSHRSGFPNWRENEPDNKLKIKFEPGTNFEYSGEGYQYLALVLKEIDGGNWTDLENEFQHKVAKPLKMEHSSFIPNENLEQKKAEPYDKNNNWIDLKKNYWYKKDKGNFVSASSIHTEPIDFSKWMIAVMNKEQLSKSSYDELFKPHSTITAENGITYFYSLGFASDSTKPENTYYHSGSNDGFTCWYLINTEKDWGFVVFTNSEYGIELGENLFDYLRE